MLPSKRSKKSRNFLIKMSRLHGTHTADKKPMNLRTSVMLLLSSIFVVMHINGLIHVWPNFKRICNSLMVEPIGFQLLTRMTMRFVNNDEQLVSEIHDTIEKFYKSEEKEPEKRKILDFSVKIIEILSKSYMLLNFICFMIPPMSALIISWISKEFFMLVPLWLPFTDPNEIYGFAINTSAMFFFCVMFYELLISQDLFFIHYTLQVIPMGDILIHKMRQLGEKLSASRKSVKILANTQNFTIEELIKTRQKLNILENSIKQHEKDIINLIKSFNSYNSFISLIHPYMHYTKFVEISTNAVGIGLAILVANLFSISIGISVILIYTLQVLMSCIQGTVISHQNQKILDETWNFPWYKMSIPMQKVWLQFMHQCQSSNELEIVMIGVLNMECFTNVMNGAYSYFMYILNFVKN
ncbi:hypothetical protein ACKWTF_014880 [Chironomus riparius]